jgi:hypothetical protein
MQGAGAQSGGSPGSDVMVSLTGSGSQWKTVTYNDGSGRFDALTNQISVSLRFHPYSPQPNGYLFSSASADVSGTITIQFNGTEKVSGASKSENLQNQVSYNEPGFAVQTGFFGPQFIAPLPGEVSSLALTPPTTTTQNPEPYQLSYDGTNGILTLWIRLPSPFTYQSYPSDAEAWTIPCKATVTGNGSSFAGLLQDASTGKPLAGATVLIGGEQLTTDANGSFFVPLLPTGSLAIQISAPGYDSYQKTEPLAPFSAVSVTFQLKPVTSYLTVVDANPLFLSSTVLPQPISPALWETLAVASTTRASAAADGVTQLLLRYTNSTPGSVMFGLIGDGALKAVDGSDLPALGVDTVLVQGQQMAFALYTVPDQAGYSGNTVTFVASFAPSGGSNPLQQSSSVVDLVQTPVVLVHGLWGKGVGIDSTWHKMRTDLAAKNITAREANYYDSALYAAGPFEAYGGIVNQTIQSMLNSMRGVNIAVAKADVVAHSMGGILTRIDSNATGSHLPENYNAGYMRRVITVDTPHWGSCAAPMLSLLATDVPLFSLVLGLAQHPVNKGAVEDLNPAHFAVNSGGSTSAAYKPLNLPCYAIGGLVGSSADFSHDLATLYFVAFNTSLLLSDSQYNDLASLLCGQQFIASDGCSGMAAKMFLGQANDGVVAMSSQNGGCATFIDYQGVEHTTAPTNQTVEAQIMTLLEGPVSAFSKGCPAVTQAELNTQICGGAAPGGLSKGDPSGRGALPKDQIPLMKLVAPSDGATFSPGADIPISAQPLANVSLSMVVFLASGSTPGFDQLCFWDTVTNAPFSDTMTAPTNIFGPLTITAIGVDSLGNYDLEQVAIQVLPGTNLTLESISVDIDSVGTNMTFSQLAAPQQLVVSGTYSDGAARDITTEGAGTVYSTSAESVAVVDRNGSVSAVGNGSAQITLMNQGISAQVPVQVHLQRPQIMSVQPDGVSPGASSVTLCIVGSNLGGASSVAFFRDGQADTNVTVGRLVVGVSAANIQAPVNVPSKTPPGKLTVVVTTPVGSSAQTPTQGNQFSVGQPLVLKNVGFRPGGPGSGGFGFSIVGAPGSSFLLQTSPDLVNWTNQGTTTLSSGSFTFIDTNALSSSRYYRAEFLP